MLVIIISLVAMTGFLMRYFLIRPFDRLLKGIKQISRGNYAYSIGEFKHMEIETVISEFSKMAAQIQSRERSLQESEEYHRELFEGSPTALYMQDFSDVENRVRELKQDHTDDLRQYLIDNPHEVSRLSATVRIFSVNHAAVDLYKADSPEHLMDAPDRLLVENDRSHFIDQIVSFTDGMDWYEGAARKYNFSGEIIHLIIRKAVIHRKINGLTKILVSLTDVTELHRAYKEKESLEARLQRAKKMEALGLLAGGVAHDLNNVLSGIVSYPDLILMDLEADSHLRKPILTIQNSGQKASEIVEDLLTLARRGVATKDIINLNDTISEYLKSPEFEKLSNFHPEVRIEANLGEALLNIVGSPIHLRKTIMNLVSNGAEAQPAGGKITISTTNQYVDKPIKGYEEIREGDFVMMEVADTGTGISTEDMSRIFEPFYTKKVMGRSGTGLGMSVVWGTVQDHQGYINVESTKHVGTTFRLYFPATREQTDTDSAAVSIDAYMGRKEKILVIDDIKEQREIALTILERLNYSATAVSSGEKAVQYMKSHTVDLLLLDMIMEPGMDGLDTYKKILETHPGQKAIIASGYSETDHVREAQRLGAGEYVKKPYTLREIGRVLKKELSR